MDTHVVLNDLRILHHIFTSCYAANSKGPFMMMRKMFTPYLSKYYPFCLYDLPFDIGLKKSGFSVGFVGSFPATPVMLELQLPYRGVQYKYCGPNGEGQNECGPKGEGQVPEEGKSCTKVIFILLVNNVYNYAVHFFHLVIDFISYA